MTWFFQLFGFPETTPDEVRAQFQLQGETLRSLVNGKSYHYGKLATPRLPQVRKRAKGLNRFEAQLTYGEVFGDVQDFHLLPENAGAVFQAASQFNLLEMVGPGVTPEAGVGIYEHDHTQGPACAIACGAGTVYRNYFAPVGEQIGQSEHQQIDCLYELGQALGNSNNKLWTMRNGYALATEQGLNQISNQIKAASPAEYVAFKDQVRIGLQWDTEVTLTGSNGQHVTQAYCSALPVAYSGIAPELWELFARLVLEATYEATFYAAIINYELTGNPRLFLTRVGGGAFGNEPQWIDDAIGQSLQQFGATPLEVKMVTYA